jgi:hypothetical protein
MAWIRIESSVARNKKFVKAGPAPSWLWLCGLCYCQEGLTDGFIPREALPYLGVKNAPQLAAFLVKSGLWDEVEGGWQVHDYLSHNRSAAEVAELKDRRGSGGKLGGRPKKNLHGNLPITTKVLGSETSGETFPVAVVVDGSVDVLSSPSVEKKRAPDFDGQKAFMALTAAYPSHRRSDDMATQGEFITQVFRDGQPLADFRAMLDNLENHKGSEEWGRGVIPSLFTWLAKGKWRGRYDVGVKVETSKTAGNRAAFQRFIERGQAS